MSRRRLIPATFVVLGAAQVWACSDDPTAPIDLIDNDASASTDASGTDAGRLQTDSSVDPVDAGGGSDAMDESDASLDAGVDGGLDAGDDGATLDAGDDGATLDAGDDGAADASTGEDAASDAGPDAEADAGLDAGPTVGACGAGKWEIGEYGTYSGKVNVHRNRGGLWSVDSDCASGSNNNTLAYCQKFWPLATSQVSTPVAGNKPFTAGGGAAPACGGVFNEPGQAQYACCADNPCPDGEVPVGTYATWSGKVNVHRETYGTWAVDSDCSSGANVNTVSYCKKFWPAATSQVSIDVEAGQKPFTAGGGSAPTCGGSFPGPGVNQYACCAPR